MAEYRIIVCGSRYFTDYEFFSSTLDEILGRYAPCEIVSGHSKGVDTMAEQYAREHGLTCKLFPPQWGKYGKAAGPARNKEMLDYALAESSVIIAFWDGKSPGTKNMIAQGEKTVSAIHIVRFR